MESRKISHNGIQDNKNYSEVVFWIGKSTYVEAHSIPDSIYAMFSCRRLTIIKLVYFLKRSVTFLDYINL